MEEDRPRTLGNYAVEGELARGGMGVVLLGRQPGLDRPAVLKKLRRGLAEEPDLLERFRREARAAARVHHQNVVAVYDCFSHRGEEYIAQEYVDGVDLRAALAHVRRFPARVASLVLLEVARGLEAIHEGGTVHRDLKPANILLGREGEVKIADFGIAIDTVGEPLTRPGLMIGTPVYMPPEQMLGERVDASGDLFSLGVVLYELLAGETPYREPDGETASTLLAQMRGERHRPVRKVVRGVPGWLGRLIRSCLRARSTRRPGTALVLRSVLERRLGAPSPKDCRAEIATWLREHGVFERRDEETRVQARPSTRRWRPLRAAVVLLACAAVGSSVFIVRARGETPLHRVTSAAFEIAERLGLDTLVQGWNDYEEVE